MRVSVGVDLHKSQFSVYYRYEGTDEGMYKKYSTQKHGYEEFLSTLRGYRSKGVKVKVAVESTGNARYFKNAVEREGIKVTVINTLNFKVVNESVKKTDKRDAKTIAEFLEKDMLPESKLCSEKSEALRRVLKSRKSLVRTIVSIKNQVHGLLLGYGIESKKEDLQSVKKRRQILTVLAEHGYADATVKPLLEIIERVSEEVKKLEKVLMELIKEDRAVEIVMSIPRHRQLVHMLMILIDLGVIKIFHRMQD